MRLLVDAGLIYVQMGIQTGSGKIQELFNRTSMSNERVMKAVRIINSHKDRMFPPSYDFILDVPYETDRDVIDSLRLIAGIPKPYQLQPFALVLYPGTRLHEMATKDGFVTDEQKQIYAKSYTMREANYLNLLMTHGQGRPVPRSAAEAARQPAPGHDLQQRPAAAVLQVPVLSLKSLKKLVRRPSRQA